MIAAGENEKARQELQEQLHAMKDQAQRNKLGQFSTPPSLAHDIVGLALSWLPARQRLRFLEPGFGTGPFYSALLRTVRESRIEAAAGYEIDPHYIEPNARLWTGMDLRLYHADFTKADPPQAEEKRFNLIVCNPPYVRHHHLGAAQKRELQALVSQRLKFEINGLSGLYAYFLVLSQAWMTEGGVGAWLIPSEFMDVNYGQKVKEFLVSKVTLLRIHRFDPNEVQFDDALVSSAVVFFSNTPPPADHQAVFSFGGTLNDPQVSRLVRLDCLRKTAKWTHLPQQMPRPDEGNHVDTLADLFVIKRGLATGCNSFFVLSPEQVHAHELPAAYLQPILPSPRDLETTEILADDAGEPLISKRRYLLSCDLPEESIEHKCPALWHYLELGMKERIHERYLCRHREPWYCQESRPAAPFLCTYMGRPSAKSETPFRFILNHSQATAANVYLMLYPKPRLTALLKDTPGLSKAVWEALSSVASECLIGSGRTYGGGLHKLEPSELANIPAEAILRALPREAKFKSRRQLSLFTP